MLQQALFRQQRLQLQVHIMKDGKKQYMLPFEATVSGIDIVTFAGQKKGESYIRSGGKWTDTAGMEPFPNGLIISNALAKVYAD